jgi:ABC-type nitrate/sulfonate/bicarbonate transport system permease component
VAIAPLLIVWFGFDILPKIIIVWLVCFFPITVGGVDGFASVDPDAARTFHAMGATRWQIFWKLRLLSAFPSLFSGIRIAITYSIAGAILGEYVGAEKGLGRLISLYARSFARDLVFAVVFVTAVLSLVLFAAVTLAQRRVMPWYFAMRSKGIRG